MLSKPTLRWFEAANAPAVRPWEVYFAYSPYDESTGDKEESKNANLYVIAPESGSKMPFNEATARMRKVLFNHEDDGETRQDDQE